MNCFIDKNMKRVGWGEHELVHVWQYQGMGFGYFTSYIGNLVSGGFRYAANPLETQAYFVQQMPFWSIWP